MKYLKEGKGKDNIGNPDDNSAITLTEYSYTAAGRIKEIITKPMTASCHSDGWLSSGFKQEKLRNPQQLKMTTTKQMLMYGKEASNRKQEIDRQHHTIPNQRPKDKHRGNVYNLLFRHGKVRSQNMEKLKHSFPTFCKQTFPQLHKTASYAHSHSADYYGIPLYLHTDYFFYGIFQLASIE